MRRARGDFLDGAVVAAPRKDLPSTNSNSRYRALNTGVLESLVVLMRHEYKLVETVGVYYLLGKLADIMRAEPELLEAARAFAIENMRHRNGGLFRRFHSKALANKVYRQIKVGQ